MMISLYKYLMGLIKLLDRFHLMPEVKEFYKDFKVKDARINYIDECGNHHRNIYISVVI